MAMDTDGSGEIDYSEFLVLWKKLLAKHCFKMSENERNSSPFAITSVFCERNPRKKESSFTGGCHHGFAAHGTSRFAMGRFPGYDFHCLSMVPKRCDIPADYHRILNSAQMNRILQNCKKNMFASTQ